MAVEVRDIPGHEGYRVSADGTVFSCWKSGYRFAMTNSWHALKPWPAYGGYLHLTIRRTGGGLRRAKVHHLVLEAFVRPKVAGEHGCHCDGNRVNNSFPNLRWDTAKGNVADTIRHGTIARGTKLPQSKLTPEKVLEAFALRHAGRPTRSIAKHLGVLPTSLNEIFRRERWRHVAVPEELLAPPPRPPRTHCRRGHPLAEHGHSRPGSPQHIRCKACDELWWREKRKSEAQRKVGQEVKP
jgi:hypothetical protein